MMFQSMDWGSGAKGRNHRSRNSSAKTSSFMASSFRASSFDEPAESKRQAGCKKAQIDREDRPRAKPDAIVLLSGRRFQVEAIRSLVLPALNELCDLFVEAPEGCFAAEIGRVDEHENQDRYECDQRNGGIFRGSREAEQGADDREAPGLALQAVAGEARDDRLHMIQM